jgi:hypothetical protein
MKPKIYWMVACPHCGGTGREPAYFTGYRISEELQDEGPYLLNEVYSTLQEAKKKVKQMKDSSIMHQIIAPNGEIVG